VPKAYIWNQDTGKLIYVMFNPKEYRISKSNYWQAARTSGGNVPPLTFASGNPATLQVQLFFDTYLMKTDVRKHTNEIVALMKVRPAGAGRKKERPDWVKFCWGLDMKGFPSVVTQVNQNFTLFLPTGIPVRAIVDVTFQQIEDEKAFKAQNPTSGGSPGRTTHVVAAGETLDLIAFQELGDAKAWRRLAELNGITDPLRLSPGRVLTVEPED
jgi:hypothetical protein